MKKITLLSGLALISSLLFTGRSSGQITIDQTDMPYVGLTVVTDSDGTSKPSYGPKGGPQVWDFSGLQKQQAKTILFMAPGSTQYSSAFPSANLADSTIGGNGYNFFNISAGNFEAVGAEEIVIANATPFQIEMNLAPPFEQSSLPATLGSTVLQTTAEGMEQFSVTFSVIVTGEKFTDTISYNDTVDAWGTMKMPNGQTYPVLRQRHNEIDYEDVYLAYFNVFSTTPYERIVTKKYQYNWYAKGVGYILAEMDMDSTTSNVKDIIWDTTAPAPVLTGLSELSNSGKTYVYPNPASSRITIESANQPGLYLTIFDITGRKIDRTEMYNGKTVLNTSTYNNGVYIYTLTDPSGSLIDRGKFTVQK